MKTWLGKKPKSLKAANFLELSILQIASFPHFFMSKTKPEGVRDSED